MTATHANAGIAAWRFELTTEVSSYEDAVTALQDSGDSRTIGPNMTLRRNLDEGFIEVVLYDTPIIRYYPDGTFSVDNGGFATPTTRERLQAVLPDGYVALHHSTAHVKHKIGLWKNGLPGPTRARVQNERVLWPLDHTIHINPTTGRKVN